MIALIQRTKQASILVEGKQVANIDHGLLVFIGIYKEDTIKNGKLLFDKIRKFRIFEDEQKKMNLNVQQAGGQLLLVPQFTLAATTTNGNRPSFDRAAKPDDAAPLFEQLISYASTFETPIQTGVFQADMQVSLVNDGPITFWLEK